jgi:gamma-glutamylaminecyclotransferase
MIVQGRYFSPVIMPESGQGHRIVGELWEVDDAKLKELDHLETTHLPTGYIRETIAIEVDGRETTANVYFKPRDRVQIVHSEPHADYQDRRYVPASQRSG